MVKKQKLFERIQNNPKNVKFSDFITILGSFGFELKRINGSHQHYKHPDVPLLLSIQPRKDGKAKPYQIEQFLDAVTTYKLSIDE